MGDMWAITIIGMGTVMITLAILALLVRGLGIALTAKEKPPRRVASAGAETRAPAGASVAQKRAAAIAAVIAYMDSEKRASLTSGGDAWALGARMDAVRSRTLFCEGKEHWAWHEYSG